MEHIFPEMWRKSLWPDRSGSNFILLVQPKFVHFHMGVIVGIEPLVLEQLEHQCFIFLVMFSDGAMPSSFRLFQSSSGICGVSRNERLLPSEFGVLFDDHLEF